MKPLLQLLADNRGRGFFRAEKSGDEATLYVYDVIVADDFWGGVSAQSFVKELAAIKAPTIHLRINSPGGDVFAARAMEQAVREHPSRVVTHIDGYAASAASYLALAADEVQIAEGGFYMIHKAWTVAFGNADDLMDMAALLEKVDGSLIATYARETGQTPEQIGEWMSAETWFNAEEAVEHGFADSIAEAAPKASAAWNLAAYAHAPKQEDVPPVSAGLQFTNTDHLMRQLKLVATT
jgi:ATP-dependent Clp protease protease subunit